MVYYTAQGRDRHCYAMVRIEHTLLSSKCNFRDDPFNRHLKLPSSHFEKLIAFILENATLMLGFERVKAEKKLNAGGCDAVRTQTLVERKVWLAMAQSRTSGV